MSIIMHERFWARAAAATAFVFLAAILGSHGAFAGSAEGGRPLAIGGTFAPAGLPGHLYVLGSTLSVYRYPLAPDGLPSANPDGVLTLEGAIISSGIAVDRSGNVFVADEGTGNVSEYAAGATGPQEPISILHIGVTRGPQTDLPEKLRMDSAERLYVQTDGGDHFGGQLEIFAKGAQGNDPPINIIQPFYSREGVVDYLITPSGTLFVMEWSMGASILGYRHPLRRNTKPEVFMWTEGEPLGEFDVGYSMAYNEPTDQLYFQFLPQDHWKGFRYTMNFAVRKPLDYGTQPDRTIWSQRCGFEDEGGSNGAVIVKEYLMVACSDDYNVLVYRKDLFGIRQPVEIMRGPWDFPVGIAVGP